jgi:hypothetical protein
MKTVSDRTNFSVSDISYSTFNKLHHDE